MENRENNLNPLIYEQKRKISSAFIDSTVRLGLAQTALLVQDNLTECFAALECDGVTYRKYNAFWVFTKTKIRFYNRPSWRETIKAVTFPVNNMGMRTHINTAFYSEEGKLLVSANQEGCVLDFEKHRPLKLTSLPYPKENFPEPVFESPFEKFDIPQEDYKEVYKQTVRSQHIDMSNHMNNIEYIKLALNIWTDDFLKANDAEEIEVHYTGESKEGQELCILKAEKDKSTYVKIMEGERQVFEMKITFSPSSQK